jgi:hypothetical protein
MSLAEFSVLDASPAKARRGEFYGVDMRRLGKKTGEVGAIRLLPVIIAFCLATLGCSPGTSSEQRLNEALTQAGTSKKNLGKFAGIVTVDGHPTGLKIHSGHAIVIMLYDAKNPPSETNRILHESVMCVPVDGSFEFSTYDRGDGVPVGSYIALFSDLATSNFGGPRFRGPDRFKNRFNDPERNAKDPQFQVEITSPGRTDWHFNLVTEGNDPPATPGAKTVVVP